MKRTFDRVRLPERLQRADLHRVYEEVVRTNLAPHTDVDLCLSGFMPGVYDQGEEGSCTANAGVALREFLARKRGDQTNFSRQFLYIIERLADGDFDEDAGSTLSQCARQLITTGVCSEALLPYNMQDEFEKPPQNCFDDASLRRASGGFSITTVDGMKQCLSNGFPFIFGIDVPTQLMAEGFDGWLPESKDLTPLIEDGQPAGHALTCVGFKTDNKIVWYKIRNSWGTGFALNGYFWVREEFMADPSWVSDCVTVRL